MTTARQCIKNLKTLHPGGIRILDLLFCTRSQWPLCHASRALEKKKRLALINGHHVIKKDKNEYDTYWMGKIVEFGSTNKPWNSSTYLSGITYVSFARELRPKLGQTFDF
jgi:hypothetical protein